MMSKRTVRERQAGRWTASASISIDRTFVRSLLGDISVSLDLVWACGSLLSLMLLARPHTKMFLNVSVAV